LPNQRGSFQANYRLASLIAERQQAADDSKAGLAGRLAGLDDFASKP
jgi:hypothetical protein